MLLDFYIKYISSLQNSQGKHIHCYLQIDIKYNDSYWLSNSGIVWLKLVTIYQGLGMLKC